MNIIIPSIIAKNQKELIKRINKVKNNFSLLQLDVMDGKFVNNESINFDFKLPRTKCKYEAHLMIKNPKEWIKKNYRKVDTIVFHFEAIENFTKPKNSLRKTLTKQNFTPSNNCKFCNTTNSKFSIKEKEINELIKEVKLKKKKVGIAINPRTRIEKIKKYLNKIDLVLVMTVNPGFYGSTFVPSTLKKIKQLRKLKPKLNIEVDGSISDKTIQKTKEAGASSFVSGSYIQKTKNIKGLINTLRLLIKKVGRKK